MTHVTPQKVPGALALGLLASLVAHAALFGTGHAMGGAYHALLMQTAIVAVLGVVAFFGAIAWIQSGTAADGSVLGVRLRGRLPHLYGVLAATAFWYAAAEAVEPHHAGASLVGTLFALGAAAWIVLQLARRIADVLARAVIAVVRITFSPRTPAWKRRARLQPLQRRTFWSRRRFARPPPIAVFRCA